MSNSPQSTRIGYVLELNGKTCKTLVVEPVGRPDATALMVAPDATFADAMEAVREHHAAKYNVAAMARQMESTVTVQGVSILGVARSPSEPINETDIGETATFDVTVEMKLNSVGKCLLL